MSVALHILDKDTRAFKVIPVAAQATFLNEWVLLCAELQLALIPEMSTGALVVAGVPQRNQLIEELEALIASCNDTSREHLCRRAEDVLAAIKAHPLDRGELSFGQWRVTA